jgi:transcriptional regulator with PAS, ATPase and Fis domain
MALERWNIHIGLVTAGGAQPLLASRPGSGIRPLLFPLEDLKAQRVHAPVVQRQQDLEETIAPILIEGECAGWLAGGPYRRKDELGRSNLASADIPVLDGRDRDYLREMLQSMADEIVVFRRSQPKPAGEPNGEAPAGGRYPKIIGRSEPMLRLYRLLDRVVASDSTVLIQGENGTGKELIAQAIHYHSVRRDKPFVVQNCSAFNDNLLDSELFGHKRGAFTGAIADKRGLFEVADGGTFFLDEIGDMSPALQVKLLRVLQEGTFIPVGDTRAKQVDVRIIAATNRDLKELLDCGEFREDLFYRVNVINIRIPPLRERREDIPLLIEHFLAKQRRLGHAAIHLDLPLRCKDQLLAYHWPGNVRELENEIERIAVLAGDSSLIEEQALSERIQRAAPEGTEGMAGCLPVAVESLERRMILEVLQRNHWNKTRAALELKISRRNLIRKVQKYQLESKNGDGATAPSC